MALAFWGPRSRLGAIVAITVFVVDQAVKHWLLYVYVIGMRGRVEITPFFDIVLAWNIGVSYGLFAGDSQEWQWILAGFSVVVSLGLWVWLSRIGDDLGAWALALVIGGALGNAMDRVLHGAVADFFSLHFMGFYWYVFNVADVAIVAGVMLLLYDAFFGSGRSKAAGKA
jgi:signal peptidase II